MIDNDTYTYLDCAEYPKIMAHHVKKSMRQGDKQGYPIIDADKGDVPPSGTAVYDATSAITSFKPHMTKPHSEMPFLRAVSLNEAIEHLCNEGHPPVQVATYVTLTLYSTLTRTITV